MTTTAPAAPRVTYREVCAEPRFRLLLLTRSLAIGADTLRTVALSMLIFAVTGSPPLLATMIYGAAFLPQAIGGTLLGALADRVRPRPLITAGYGLPCSAQESTQRAGRRREDRWIGPYLHGPEYSSGPGTETQHDSRGGRGTQDRLTRWAGRGWGRPCVPRGSSPGGGVAGVSWRCRHAGARSPGLRLRSPGTADPMPGASPRLTLPRPGVNWG